MATFSLAAQWPAPPQKGLSCPLTIPSSTLEVFMVSLRLLSLLCYRCVDDLSPHTCTPTSLFSSFLQCQQHCDLAGWLPKKQRAHVQVLSSQNLTFSVDNDSHAGWNIPRSGTLAPSQTRTVEKARHRNATQCVTHTGRKKGSASGWEEGSSGVTALGVGASF